MHMTRRRSAIAALALATVCADGTAQHDPQQRATSSEARQLVTLPDAMRVHALTNMRDHLLALEEINAALAAGAFEKAASVAEQRIGLSSLDAHGAAHLAPYMPKRMQDIGSAMHRAASRFAVETQNASVGNDVRPSLAALSGVIRQCVACHAAYRFQ
jgi:hypothetical protein